MIIFPVEEVATPQLVRGVVALFLAALLASTCSRAETPFGYRLEWRRQIAQSPILALKADPESHWIAVGHRRTIDIVPLSSNNPTLPPRRLPTLDRNLVALAISPNGKNLAALDEQGMLYLFDLGSAKLVRTLSAESQATTLAFTGDASYIVAGTRKGTIRAWTPAGDLFADLNQGHQSDDLLLVAGVSSQDRNVISVGADRRIVLWNTDLQQVVRSTGVDYEVLTAAYGGGKLLALGLRALTSSRFRSATHTPMKIDSDDVVRLIDVQTGSTVLDLRGNHQDLRALGLTPDDRFVAAGGSAKVAVIWQVDSGSPLTRVPLDAAVTSLTFTLDGKWMAIGTDDGELSLFQLQGVDARHRPAPQQGQPVLIVIIQPEALQTRSSPNAPTQIDAPAVRIQGRVRSPAKLRNLQVAGRDITSIATTESGYLFQADVNLQQPGQHSIEILAEDEAGNVGHETLWVERTASSNALATTSTLPNPAQGRRLALIVGVSKYQNPAIDLAYASRDAQALYDLLTSTTLGPSAFQPRDVHLLLDENATTTGIKTGLNSFLQSATEGDFVLFYFAGHGMPNPNRIQDLYLLTHDTDPDNIAGTGLLMRHVREALAQVRARDVLILTDACHSAGIAAPAGIRSVRVNPIHDTFLETMRHASGGLAILTASEAAQASLEGPMWKDHGVFTFFLLEGLQGKADADANRLVSLGELMEFVRDQVKQATNARQIPAIGPTSFDRQLPLLIVPGGSDTSNSTSSAPR